MDPRYTRASSPPRHYTRNPNRNSTSVLDLHPQYDQYGNPKGRDPIPGPRPPTERIAPRQPVPPRIYRDAIPIRSNRIDDYDIPPRRHEPVRRPVSVTPGSSAQPYRPSVPEKPPPSYVKPWPREDESYYIQPASTARRDPHNRHISMDQNKKPDPYLVPARSDRDRPERGGYRSSGIGGSRQQYQEVPQIRPPRDKDDKDYGYEYTDFKEQAYRDINNAPRARPRRTSDLGGRERPHSITGIEDTYRPPRPPREGYGREAGPPVSTRGFSKIDRNGSVRHEYRYPREPESARSGDESDATSRRKTNKPAVSLHQEGSNGYSSNIEERGPKEHRHRHRADSIDRSNRPRGDSIDRAARPRGESNDRTTRRRGEDFDRGYEDKNRYPNENDDLRRKDHREKRQENVRTESEERRPRHHHSHRQYREGSQDLYKPEPSRRGDEPEKDYKEHKQRDRGDESEREHRHRDRADDYDKRRDEGKKDKQDSHYGTGAALGAAGAAAAGLLGAKHHFSKEKERAGSDASSEQVPREGKPSRVPEPSEASSRNEEHSDEERRERRRKRREEKDARARQETLAASGGDRLAPPPAASTRAASRDRGGQYPPPSLGEHSDEERKNRRHRRRQSERRHSSTDSASDEPQRPRQVRVVSPGRQPEVKPKGILRRPREKFPEDPAPVREGVAPLKDAGKKGIPPNARWTKIDRRLVNPEALNMGNERFEERLDYVIVLRVLSKEEIEQYAQKTVELREARHKEANQFRLEAPREDDDYSDDEYEERKPSPRAIEDHPYNSNENLPPRDREQERMAPYSQPPAASNMTASMPSLAPNVSDKDPNRPELYPSNSYHRPAPPPSSNASSAASSTYPPPPNANAYPPPPPPQQAPPPFGYPAQQSVTGEYTQSGYPAIPPPSQAIYPQPNYQQGAPLPPPQGPPQNVPWQAPPQPVQPQQEAEPMPMPR